MQLYQFEKIYSQMEREFGKIRKGEEETYAMLLLPMEGNVLKIHREFPESNSRRLREAIALALFDIKGNYSREKYDTDNFRNKENERLERELQNIQRFMEQTRIDNRPIAEFYEESKKEQTVKHHDEWLASTYNDR